MVEEELKAGMEVEAVKVKKGNQYVPPGTKGHYLGELPGVEGCHGIEWDVVIRQDMKEGKLTYVTRDEFRVVREGE